MMQPRREALRERAETCGDSKLDRGTCGHFLPKPYPGCPRHSEGNHALIEEMLMSACPDRILVIHYWVTNYPQTRQPKQLTFMLAQFLWVRNQVRLSWVSCLTTSHSCRQGVSPDAGFPGLLAWGRVCLSSQCPEGWTEGLAP